MAIVALKPKVTNQLGFSFPLSNTPSPAVRMGRKLECREGQDVRERSFSHRRSCDMTRAAQQHAFERDSWMVSWPLNWEVVVTPSLISMDGVYADICLEQMR